MAYGEFDGGEKFDLDLHFDLQGQDQMKNDLYLRNRVCLSFHVKACVYQIGYGEFYGGVEFNLDLKGQT
jgi:hypothetical protein